MPRWTIQAAGCDRVYQEHGSGASRIRPVLTRLLGELGAGDVLVVVRLDRHARSVSHLLTVIENLDGCGVHFRSIRNPIDTSTPQGMISLQVLGAVAQLERALIAERTKTGINDAKSRGKIPENPGLRERRPEAIKAVSQARDKRYLDELLTSAQTWLPMVRQLRPQHSPIPSLRTGGPPDEAGGGDRYRGLSLRDIAAQLNQMGDVRREAEGNGNRRLFATSWMRPIVSVSSVTEDADHRAAYSVASRLI